MTTRKLAFEIKWPLPNTGVFSIRHRVSTWRLPIKNTHEMIQLIRDLIIYWNQIFSKNKIQMVEWVVVLQIVTSVYQIIIKKAFFSEQFSFFSKSAYTNIIVLQKNPQGHCKNCYHACDWFFPEQMLQNNTSATYKKIVCTLYKCYICKIID